LKQILLNILIYLVFSISIIGQKGVTERAYPGLDLDYGSFRTREIQLDLNYYYVPKSSLAYGVALGAGWNFKEPRLGFYSEVSFDLIGISPALFYGVFNNNFRYYPQAGKSLFYAPEVGFGLFFLQFSYQPMIGIRNQTPVDMIKQHQFRIKIVGNPTKLFGSMMRTSSYVAKSWWNAIKK
jgi:hypothetical protein